MLKPKEQKNYTCPNCNQSLTGLRGEKVKIHINMCLPEFFKRFNHLRTLPNPKLINEVGNALKKGLISRPKSNVKRTGLLPTDQPTPPAPTRVIKKTDKSSAAEGTKGIRESPKPRGLPCIKAAKGNFGSADMGKLPESNLNNIVIPESLGWTPMINTPMIYSLAGKKKSRRSQVQFANPANLIPAKRKRFDPEISIDLFEGAIGNARKKMRRRKTSKAEGLVRSLFLNGLNNPPKLDGTRVQCVSNNELAEMIIQVTKEVKVLQRNNDALGEQNEDFWENCISQLENMNKNSNVVDIEKLTKSFLSKCAEPLKASTAKESIEWNWLVMRGLRRDGVKRKS